MAIDNFNLNFEPNSKKNGVQASANSMDKKVTKLLKPLSVRPTRSVKKNNSLKQAFNKVK